MSEHLVLSWGLFKMTMKPLIKRVMHALRSGSLEVAFEVAESSLHPVPSPVPGNRYNVTCCFSLQPPCFAQHDGPYHFLDSYLKQTLAL